VAGRAARPEVIDGGVVARMLSMDAFVFAQAVSSAG
jgi:hypothetical protein